MSGRRESMQKAKNVKNDEFYTQYEDIEKECSHYLPFFYNKVIYCNCDTENSNFVRYFKKLKELGLIKEVLWSGGAGGIDFRSEESINLLNLADIVVTNPPFSLFREYVAQLIQYHKKFLILGNQNAVSYKDFLPRFIDKQVRLGYTAFRALLFDTPDTAYDGRKVSVGVCWFTNLSTPDKVGLNLTAFYGGNEDKYQKYDNIEAINIERLADIPCDYYGLMGVPITFLGKYEPKQFDGFDYETPNEKNTVWTKLWTKSYKTEQKADDKQEVLRNIKAKDWVRIYFTPGPDCENNIIAEINKAKKMDIAVYSITNQKIVDAILAAKDRGAKIRIITDRLMAKNKSSLVEELSDAGIPVLTNVKHKIEHNKFAVFGGRVVVTGSYNWTNNATKSNSENCLFFEQPNKEYSERFEYLWDLYGE